MSKNIYGVHDFNAQWADAIASTGKSGWCVYTHAVGCDPDDRSGHDYRESTQRNITPIARLNCGYGTAGTIPLPKDYEAFAQRCANFVAAAIDCNHWIIGNEISMKWDFPNNEPIGLLDYVRCYRMVRAAIKAVQPHAVVMPQAPAPWNVEMSYTGNPDGNWIKQLTDMLMLIPAAEVDAIALHTYSRGYAPGDITRDIRMGDPWQKYQSGFRTYRDFMEAVPLPYKHLPVHITECNGNSPWNNYQRGWVQAVYAEIANWNRDPNNQQIHSVVLFRWAVHDDQWHMGKADGVLDDLRDVCAHDYRWNETASGNVVTSFTPGQQAVTTVYLNARKIPGKTGDVSHVVDPGTVVTLLSGPLRRDSLTWWEIEGGWVAEGANGSSFLTPYYMDNWNQSFRFVQKWEGGMSWDPNDPGNYTGCQVGQGQFKGTKYGISACSFPALDIANLTLDEAGGIYYEKYWRASGASNLEWPLCLYVLDCAVNQGVGVAKQLLEESDRNPAVFNEHRRAHYRRIAGNYPAMGRYLQVWLDRVRDVEVYGRDNAPRTRSLAVPMSVGVDESVRRRRRRRDGICG